MIVQTNSQLLKYSSVQHAVHELLNSPRTAEPTLICHDHTLLSHKTVCQSKVEGMQISKDCDAMFADNLATQ